MSTAQLLESKDPPVRAAGKATSLIRLDQVVLGYRRPLLPALSLDLKRGTYLGVVGPNGGGKSTLVKTMCGILAPLSGNVVYPTARPAIGYVPQQSALDELFPLTALEVVALNLVPRLALFKRLRGEHWDRSQAALERFGIGNLSQSLFRELSGGQKQRVLLARALVVDPELLVLDEPTAAVDPVNEERVLHEIEQIRRERHLTVILVSHQLGLTASHAGRLAILDKDQHLFREGSTEHLMHPAVLREVYGTEAEVGECHGHVVVSFHL